MEGRNKQKVKYGSQMPRAMYCFFRNYAEDGVPSFRKFADSIGVTLEDIEEWRSHEKFNRAYRECSEIRRDYLIDNALCRRFDPSFVKYLLGIEYDDTANAEDELSVRLEVVN